MWQRPAQNLALVCAIAALAIGCVTYEWVNTKPEIERYELAEARKICNRWAEEQLEPDSMWEDRRRTPSTKGSKIQYFNQCMRRLGWERVPKGEGPASAPEGQSETAD